MKLLRAALPIAVRVTLLAVLATHVVVSATSQHLACAAAHHACGSTTSMSACCCGGDSEAARQAGPTVTAIRVAPTPAPADALVATALIPDSGPMDAVIDAPCVFSPDIPILLANLRL